MTDNVIKAENAAVKAIETAFINAGWSDGWGLTDDEVRAAPSPLFYRNETPAVASEARATVDGQTHSVYCIYNIIETKPNHAGNRPSNFDVTVALTFYYDDPFLFFSDEKESPFGKFAEVLMDELADGLWTISSEGESSVPATEDGQTYTNRKILFVKNNF